MRCLLSILAALAVSSLCPGGEKSPSTVEAMGVLKANCLGCHNGEKTKGGLSLETRDLALRGGENGPALVAGRSVDSLLFRQLAEDAETHMPPKKQLPEKQIALLRAWLDAGAAWDEAALKSFGEFAAADQLGALPATPQPVVALALSPDGTRLASSFGSAVLIRDVSKPERPVVTVLPGHRDIVQSIAWSADGTKLAAGGYRTVLVWETAGFTLTTTLGAPLAGRVTALAFLNDHGTLAIADGAQGQRGIVHLWSLGSLAPAATLDAHSDNILSLAVSHNGQMLATGGADHAAKVWNIESRMELAKLEGHTGQVLAVAFNQDDSWLATGSADKALKIWDLKAKEQIVLLGSKNAAVTALSWQGEGLTALFKDGTGKVYSNFTAHTGGQSTETAKEKTLPPAESMPHAVTATNDGKTVYAGSDDGIVLVWNADGKPAKMENPPPPNAPPAPPAPEVAAGEGHLSFSNDVLPILSKAGCNTGSCHAKATGQAGLKFSVFTFDPKADYVELVKDARGRRVFPALPGESLLLKKATATIPHEGGQRFEAGSQEYQTIARWIAQGAPWQAAGEPQLTRIEVSPAERQAPKNSAHALSVTAHYSNGSTRDVTALADFTSNEKGTAEVSESGLVKAGQDSGEAVIIARYMGQIAISRVAIPVDKLLPEREYANLPVANEIDRLVHARLKMLGHLPSAPCTDEEFLRRSSLDATGELPTMEEARAFLDNPDPAKRTQWIDKLLGSPAWADHWAVKWGDLLRPNPSRVGVKPVYLLDQWIRQSFRENKPWDQFTRELLTAQGSTHQSGPVAVWRDKREPADAATFVAQIFLGVRLDCAKCHHHPSEKWDMADYYQMAAFFTAMKRKGQGISAPISGEPEYWWFSPGTVATISHPVTNAALKPRPPAAAEVTIPGSKDPRAVLADWMTAPDNPLFARAVVNRVWSQFFGRGIVDPVDDFRASNPASNEPLLDWLARDFVAHKFDLKHLMRTLMQSKVYQLSSLPNDTNQADLKNFSRSYRRRLPAEVLLDAVSTVTEVRDDFSGLPAGSSAKQTWNHKLDSDFMDAFGRPNASAECPCERDAKPSVVQALHLMNSTRLHAKLVDAKGRLSRLAGSTMSPEQMVEELYLSVYSRRPTAEESAIAAQALSAAGDKKQAALEDLLWVLLNTAEFVFNH